MAMLYTTIWSFYTHHLLPSPQYKSGTLGTNVRQVVRKARINERISERVSVDRQILAR